MKRRVATSGMWRRVSGPVAADVSTNGSAFVFSVVQKHEGTTIRRNVGRYWPIDMTSRHRTPNVAIYEELGARTRHPLIVLCERLQ